MHLISKEKYLETIKKVEEKINTRTSFIIQMSLYLLIFLLMQVNLVLFFNIGSDTVKSYTLVKVAFMLAFLLGTIMFVINVLFTKDIANLFFTVSMIPMSTISVYQQSPEQKFYYLIVPFASIVFLSVIARIIINHKVFGNKFIKGQFFYELVFISIAMMLGGIGTLTVRNFKNNESALVILLLLGPIGILFYLFAVNNTNRNSDQKSINTIYKALIYVGIFICIIVFIGFISNLYLAYVRYKNSISDVLLQEQNKLKTLLSFFSLKTKYNEWRNNASQLLLICLAGPIYFIYKRINSNNSYLAGLAFLFFSILSGSRNAQLLSIPLMIILSYIFYKSVAYEKEKLYVYIFSMIFFLFLVLALKYLSNKPDKVINKIEDLSKDPRAKLYIEALTNFFLHPFFGVSFLYVPINPNYKVFDMSMYWFHNNILQVLASFGLFGAISYSVLVKKRFKIFRKNKKDYNKAAIWFYIIYLLLGLFDIVGFMPFPLGFLLILLASATENENLRYEKEKIPEVEKYLDVTFKNPNKYLDE